MADLLLKKLAAEDFNAEKFVQHHAQNTVGVEALQLQRYKIQQVAEATNAQLKKNVYMNYMQFIETAKEISYLESEMYQLSHLITEQKSLLTSLLEQSFSGERGTSGAIVPDLIEMNADELKEKRAMERRKKLTALVEKIEGCSHVMEVKDRVLIFDDDLLELNQDDYSPMQRMHLYLLNDSLMVAMWLSDRRNPVRYRFENLYPLDQVLLVNIKDRGTTKNAFKILIFPDTRVFTASSAKSKQDWLDEIERSKSNKLIADQEKIERNNQETRERKHSVIKSENENLQVNNPFSDDDEDNLNPFADAPPPTLGVPPEWVLELPEDLDQAVAQRNFEEAVELIERGRDYFENVNKTPQNNEMSRSLESRVNSLVETLRCELRVTPDKSLQGGPRAARRATTLLVKLNKSSQACDLFLTHRGAILKDRLKRLRLEGETVLYIRQLCSFFFQNLMETSREFSKAFPGNVNCNSAFVVWTTNEVKNFASIFSRHVFAVQSTLTIVAECVARADQHCLQLKDIGLDLTFGFHLIILRQTEQWIKDGRDKMCEAVKLRSQEDNWKRLKYEKRNLLQKAADELRELGVANITSFLDEEGIGFTLTNNTIQFCRSFLTFLEDVLRLLWPETKRLIDEALASVFTSHLRHCRASLGDPLFKSQIPVIRSNVVFLLDTLLVNCEHRYEEVTRHPHPTLVGLHAHRSSLMGDMTTTTVNRYESNFI